MITPLDIENKKFAKQMVNGYSVDEVDDFLDDLTVEYEKLFKENAEFKNEIVRLKEDMEHYKAIESTLQSTLVMAQTTAEDVKNVARQQADQIINEAKIMDNLKCGLLTKYKKTEEIRNFIIDNIEKYE